MHSLFNPLLKSRYHAYLALQLVARTKKPEMLALQKKTLHFLGQRVPNVERIGALSTLTTRFSYRKYSEAMKIKTCTI